MIANIDMTREPKELTIYQSDHDLLIELRVISNEMRKDVKDMKDGITGTLTDHEQRLRDLEKRADQWFGKQNTIAAFLGAAITLAAAYISKGYAHL